MANPNVSLQQLVGSFQLKKDRFISIINQELSQCDADHANLFIDVNSCIKKLYSGLFSLATIEEETELAGALISMIIYYRKLFRYNYRVDINTYLVFSNNTCRVNRMYQPEYNQAFAQSVYNNKHVTDFIMKNIEALTVLCPYLNNTAIYCTEYETAVGIRYIMENKLEPGMEDVPNIILSRDLITTQIIGTTPKHALVICPKKEAGIDISYAISKGGVIPHLMSLRKSNYAPRTDFDDSWLAFILAATKCPERNLNAVCPIDAVLTELDNAIQECRVQNKYPTNCYTVVGDLTGPCYKKLVNCNLEQRYKALDIQYQLGLYMNSPERFTFSGIQNLYSPKAVAEIFMKYFKKSPVDYNSI